MAVYNKRQGEFVKKPPITKYTLYVNSVNHCTSLFMIYINCLPLSKGWKYLSGWQQGERTIPCSGGDNYRRRKFTKTGIWDCKNGVLFKRNYDESLD